MLDPQQQVAVHPPPPMQELLQQSLLHRGGGSVRTWVRRGRRGVDGLTRRRSCSWKALTSMVLPETARHGAWWQDMQPARWGPGSPSAEVCSCRNAGRDWKACAEHVGTRDSRAIASHAQKHLIKLCINGEPLPARVAESGAGYTLSGKPLDPDSAAAKAYGFKPGMLQSVPARAICMAARHTRHPLHLTAAHPCLRRAAGRQWGQPGGYQGTGQAC